MTEKVLFEYKADDEEEGGPRIRLKVDAGLFGADKESAGSGRRATVRARVHAPWSRKFARRWPGKRGARRAWRKARRRVGETLNFFEGVYQDLYGAEDDRPTEEA